MLRNKTIAAPPKISPWLYALSWFYACHNDDIPSPHSVPYIQSHTLILRFPYIFFCFVAHLLNARPPWSTKNPNQFALLVWKFETWSKTPSWCHPWQICLFYGCACNLKSTMDKHLSKKWCIPWLHWYDHKCKEHQSCAHPSQMPHCGSRGQKIAQICFASLVAMINVSFIINWELPHIFWQGCAMPYFNLLKDQAKQ